MTNNEIEQIKKLHELVFPEKAIIGISRMGGLTNKTFAVELDDNNLYVYRLPGDGTEAIINRRHEKISTELAWNLKIDSELLYFDDSTGKKISRYVDNAITMNPDLMKDSVNIKGISKVLKILHTSGVDTGVPFDVFDMADSYQQVIIDNDVSFFDDFSTVRDKVFDLKEKIDSFSNLKVSCHNDPLCENWIKSENEYYLVDWEYAGMNDPYWDLADVSIEAGFGEEDDLLLLKCYLERIPTKEELLRFEANKVFLDFLWSLWGKTRVPFDGESMEDYAKERYDRMKRNLSKLV